MAKQAGEGLVDTANKFASKVASWIAPKTMPPKVAAFLKQHERYTIKDIQVCRVPIVPLIEKALRALAIKTVPFDRLYHLYMVVGLSSPSDTKSVKIERNQTFQI